MYDVLIRKGTLYDGTGDAPRAADVAIEGERIVAVGKLEGPARELIDASDKIVAPGFVDIHTHYDGQVTWDPYLTPSTYHGVTTVVMGNCGVGFAPCKLEQRDWLIGLLEGVEDIPGTALHAGIQWAWESFPEYLDALERTPLAIDVGAQVPHGAVRAYVMGERGVNHEAASPAEITQMAQLVAEAVDAGALGFTTSRTDKHRDSSGVLTPSITAHQQELVEIARALGALGKGVLQGISDFYDFDSEFQVFRAMTEASGRPTSITVEQQDARPEWWLQLLAAIEKAQADGLPMWGQVPPRATGLLLGLSASLNPFTFHPSYWAIVNEPFERRLEILRDPAFRTKLLSEAPADIGIPLLLEIVSAFEKMFRLQEPANYEPDPEESIAAEARRTGKPVEEIAYDILLENDGTALLYHPLFNYQPGNLDYVEQMLKHPYTVSGLSDAGAHCGALCDASFPTTLIQHWGRDRTRGAKIPLETLISMQTRETAKAVGLLDRGILAPGYKADINVIDFENLTLHQPSVVYDLPAGGRRLIQKASGYDLTLVAGKLAFENGEPRPGLNGRLIRGAQPRPGA